MYRHFLSSKKIINYFLLEGITAALDLNDYWTGGLFSFFFCFFVFAKHQVAASFNFPLEFTH